MLKRLLKFKYYVTPLFCFTFYCLKYALHHLARNPGDWQGAVFLIKWRTEGFLLWMKMRWISWEVSLEGYAFQVTSSKETSLSFCVFRQPFLLFQRSIFGTKWNKRKKSFLEASGEKPRHWKPRYETVYQVPIHYRRTFLKTKEIYL